MDVYLFFILLTLSLGFFLCEICKRCRYVKLGRPEKRCDRPWERWKGFLARVPGQKRVLAYPVTGTLHWFMMWGFVVLLINIPNMAAQGLFHTGIPYVVDNPVYLYIKDLFDVLIIIAVIGNLWRRLAVKPQSLDKGPVSVLILLLILVIALSEVLFHGSRLALGAAGAAPVAAAAAGLLARLPAGTLPVMGKAFWWAHFLAIFALFFIVPRSKHLHLVFAPFNTYWRSLAPKGALGRIEFRAKGQACGAARLEQFTWKQLFDAYACVKCGRCNDACPAYQSGEAVKPKQISGRLRKHIEARAPVLLKQQNPRRGHVEVSAPSRAGARRTKGKKAEGGGLFDEETIWNCTTCGGCQDACPVSVEHVAKIIDARRWAVSAGGSVPAGMKQALAAVEGCGNPWGAKPGGGPVWEAPAWSVDSPAEYLYYPGCAGIFDERAARAAGSLAQILMAAGVDFAVLGDGQGCCGETARRMGHEHLFQEVVQKNVSQWNALGVRRIITSCPHCFNTLKNEYPQFGGEYEIIHHSVFLADLVQSGRLRLRGGLKETAVYHDPCYLGRYNDIHHQPRKLLQSIPGLRLVNMPRFSKMSLCCGGGGGRIWAREGGNNSITKNLVKQMFMTDAAVIVTACPYCLMVLSEELQATGNSNQSLDLAEVLQLCHLTS